MASPQLTGPPASDLTDAPTEGAVSAFVLGWHVAQLFHSRVPGAVQGRRASLDKLAGIGELHPLVRARLLLSQVEVDLRRTWRLVDWDQPPPDPGPVRSLLEAESREPGQVRSAVAAFHAGLLEALTAADFRLGKAYGLGRALAETALLPDARDPETFQRLFARHRLGNLLEWLADLKSVLPPHAAEAVRGSLRAWAAWAQDPILSPALDEDQDVATRSAPPEGRPVDWGSPVDRESLTRALHRQGELWRAVLSGEKHCADTLSGDDYLRAADRLLGQLRRLTLGFLRHFWITTTALVLLAVAIVATLLFVHTASRAAAVLLAAAGAIGLTWKSAAAGLGRVLGHAQRPLWESSLDTAVADAITWLPRERRAGDRSGPPRSPSGARPPVPD
jgi:hypothetical protein